MKTLGDSFMFLEIILSMKYKKNHKQNCKRHKKLYNTGDMRWKEKRKKQHWHNIYTGGRFRGVETAGKQSMNQLNMMRQGKANQPYSMRQRAIKIKQ